MKPVANNLRPWLKWHYSPTQAAERARQLQIDIDESEGYEHASWVHSHRNGSGNGARFTTAIAEDAIVITFWAATEEGEYATGKVAIPLRAATAAVELPTVADGELVTRITPLTDGIEGETVVMVREWRTIIETNWVEHLGRHLVVLAPRHPGNSADRVAVLDLHLATVEHDATFVNNGWRPESDTSWALKQLASAES